MPKDVICFCVYYCWKALAASVCRSTTAHAHLKHITDVVCWTCPRAILLFFWKFRLQKSRRFKISIRLYFVLIFVTSEFSTVQTYLMIVFKAPIYSIPFPYSPTSIWSSSTMAFMGKPWYYSSKLALIKCATNWRLPHYHGNHFFNVKDVLQR